MLLRHSCCALLSCTRSWQLAAESAAERIAWLNAALFYFHSLAGLPPTGRQCLVVRLWLSLAKGCVSQVTDACPLRSGSPDPDVLRMRKSCWKRSALTNSQFKHCSTHCSKILKNAEVAEALLTRACFCTQAKTHWLCALPQTYVFGRADETDNMFWGRAMG